MNPIKPGTVLDHPLLRVLRTPALAGTLSANAWTDVLRAARRGLILARLGRIVADADMASAIPVAVRHHLASAQRVADALARSVRCEVREVSRTLATAGIPLVLLKGGAYIAAGMDAGQGRLVSDLDILVPKPQLDEAERRLFDAGWFPTKLDPYDQRYYREWMHELPPMQHLDRGTTLDVHHTIVPPTSKPKPAVELLWRDARPISDGAHAQVLHPADLILHSAVHLFQDGEFNHGLRDLCDIAALLAEHAGDPDFLTTLQARASAHDLERPLYYAMRYGVRVLGLAIPAEVLDALKQQARIPSPVLAAMDFAVLHSLSAIFADRVSTRTRAAQFAMYVRSHWLRMPLRLLLPHLLRKQFRAAER